MGSWKCTAKIKTCQYSWAAVRQDWKDRNFVGGLTNWDKVTNPTTFVFKTVKQERETVEGFRTGSEPVVAGKISQGSRGNREGEEPVGTETQHSQWKFLMKDNKN